MLKQLSKLEPLILDYQNTLLITSHAFYSLVFFFGAIREKKKKTEKLPRNASRSRLILTGGTTIER